MNLKKYSKIVLISIFSVLLLWDGYIVISKKITEYIESYRLEGFNIALKEVSDTALKNGGVELFVKNSDGSTTKLNLILEKKK